MSSPATSWREKLHECETHPDGESRIGWLRRTYARIYRFLISQYGSTPPSEVEHPPMPFVDRTHELEGKAARSLGEIRHALKDIAANQPEAAASRVPRDKEIWVTVAVEDKRLSIEGCLQWLGSNGIECRAISEGRRRVVRVRREQADEAFQLLAQAKEISFLEQLMSREPREPVYRDDATVKLRARLFRSRSQLGLIAFALCWGLMLCALLMQVSGWSMEGVLVVTAILCILTLTEFSLHMMRRSR